MPSPSEFYSTILPAKYQEALSTADASLREQSELTVNYEISSDEIHGLRTKGGELEYTAGGIENPDMYTRIQRDAWDSSIGEGDMDPLLDYVLRRKVSAVKALKGTVRLELDRSNGSQYISETTFGSTHEPNVTLMMSTDDYKAMVRGELDGQMAFMLGKLKFDGSLPLLMAIGALTS